MVRLILTVDVLLPFAVLFGHLRFPGNSFTPFMIPRFLKDKDHPKSVFRQAGTGLLILVLWLVTAMICILSLFPTLMSNGNQVFLGFAFFVMPIVIVMMIIVGVYYLGVGIFSRASTVTPVFRSAFVTESIQLDLYVKRMIRYTKINLISLSLAIGLPVLEALSGIKPVGIIVLVNVSFLITFILTLWRLRFYCVNVAAAMGHSGRELLLSTLGGPSKVLFLWRHAFVLRQQYEQHQGQTARQANREWTAPNTHSR